MSFIIMGKFCFLVVVESQFCICWRLAIDWGYRTSVYLACSRDCSSMVDEFLLQSPFCDKGLFGCLLCLCVSLGVGLQVFLYIYPLDLILLN